MVARSDDVGEFLYTVDLSPWLLEHIKRRTASALQALGVLTTALVSTSPITGVLSALTFNFVAELTLARPLRRTWPWTAQRHLAAIRTSQGIPDVTGYIGIPLAHFGS